MEATTKKFEYPHTLDPFIQSLSQNKYRFYLLEGGRSGGKSWAVTDLLLILGAQSEMRIVSGRETLRSIEDSNYTLFVDRAKDLELAYAFHKTKLIFNETGTEIKFRGFREYGIYNTKGLEGVDVLFIDEAQQITEKALDVIVPTIMRKGGASIVFSMNRDLINDPVYARFKDDPDCLHVKCNYMDNPFNPSSIISEAEKAKANPKKYNHIWLGEPAEGNEYALWSYDNIKYKEPPVMKRTIVAVDPAVSTKENSDETGIIVCGWGEDDMYYTIDDLSGKYTPNEWARMVENAYEKHKADCVVAEKNQGGDLVEQNLKLVDTDMKVKLVHASKGKFIRAEPIASLYEENKVRHVARFPKLENQMVTFTTDIDRKSRGSPDRVDALVWGFTELALNKKVIGSFIKPQSYRPSRMREQEKKW